MSAFPIPDAALNSHVGILGKTGSGKSYTARGLAERLLHLHRQVVIIDPTGAWYGLRTGFEIPIFGGPHGDVEIGDLAGEPVASVIVEQKASAIIDLSLMSGNGQKRFMRDFAHRLRMKPPGALYLFLDEADEFLPQEKVKGGGRGDGASTDLNLFGDLKWMVRRGRLNGFRVTMITQRPAEIAKAVLTQIETLVAHRLTAPQDRKAVEEWVKGHAEPEAHREVLSSLASLEKGVAWVWAPDLGILVKAKMPAIETFDSGRTPEPGEIEVKPPALADLNLSAIKEKLATVEAEAKANDPAALKTEVARLTRELAAKNVAKNIPANIPAPAWPDQRDLVAQLTAELADHSATLERLTVSAAELQRRQQAALTALGGESVAIPAVTPPRPRVIPAPAPVQRQPVAPREVRQSEGIGTLPPGERAVLIAAVQYDGVDRDQLSVLTGYKRSTRDAYIARLRDKGLVYVSGSTIGPAAGAEEALGSDYQPLPTGPDLRAYWMERLPPGEAAILGALIDEHPTGLARSDLDERTGYKRSSRDAYIQRLKARRLVEICGSDVKASEVLF